MAVARVDMVAAEPAVAVYFSTPDCGVCQALYARLVELLQDYPRVVLVRADCVVAPGLAAQLGVLAVPTLVVYLDGREAMRKTRHFSLKAQALERPYRLLLDAQ